MSFRNNTRKSMKKNIKSKKSKKNSRFTRKKYVGGVTAGICVHGKIKYNCPICKYKYMQF